MKYALIGCGRIATNHVKAAVNNKLEFVAVCDKNQENMDALLKKHGLEKDTSMKHYTDYKKMVEENEIELISIATESGIHAEIAIYCINHGIHVIIEKPMAMSMSDAEEIIRLSEEKHVKVSACHQNRFNVAVQEMRKAVEAGRFGRLSERKGGIHHGSPQTPHRQHHPGPGVSASEKRDLPGGLRAGLLAPGKRTLPAAAGEPLSGAGGAVAAEPGRPGAEHPQQGGVCPGVLHPGHRGCL